MSFYSNDSTYKYLKENFSIATAVLQKCLIIILHECACLAGFLAGTDECLPLDVTYVDTVRIPPSVLGKGIICGAPLAQHSTAVKKASQIALT
jgi:hypothetical protein